MASQSEFDALLGVFVIVIVVNFVSMGFLRVKMCVSQHLYVFPALCLFVFFFIFLFELFHFGLFATISSYFILLLFFDACFYYNERKEQCRFDWVEK